jgi:hypothetical protein
MPTLVVGRDEIEPEFEVVQLSPRAARGLARAAIKPADAAIGVRIQRSRDVLM